VKTYLVLPVTYDPQLTNLHEVKHALENSTVADVLNQPTILGFAGAASLEFGAFQAPLQSEGFHLHNATQDLLETIENTGGVVLQDDGLHHLACDEDWIDLAEAYIKLCEVAGRTPKVREEQ
jgi:hypothetical protein